MGDSGNHRVSGLNVCKDCYNTDYLPARLRDRGFHMGYSYRSDTGTVESEQESLDSSSPHSLSVLGEIPHPTEIQCNLAHEGIMAKLIKLIEHELQVGDKEFDNAIWIHTSTMEETGVFLKLSGVQEAVMELITMKGELDIEGNKLSCKAHEKGPIEVRRFLLNAAALLHYMSEFSVPPAE